MKKLFIGLLILAAGAGVYFLLQTKKDKPVAETINRELVLGKWTPVSTEPVKDSAETAYSFDFRERGIVLRISNDTAVTDTTHYEWTAKNELLIKENTTDTTGKLFTVLKLTQDSLHVQSEDKTSFIFTKAK